MKLLACVIVLASISYAVSIGFCGSRRPKPNASLRKCSIPCAAIQAQCPKPVNWKILSFSKKIDFLEISKKSLHFQYSQCSGSQCSCNGIACFNCTGTDVCCSTNPNQTTVPLCGCCPVGNPNCCFNSVELSLSCVSEFQRI